MANKTIKEVTMDFFKAIGNGIAKNSSQGYAIIVINDIKKSLAKEFPFVKLVKISASSVNVDNKINSVEPLKIGRLFIRIIGLLGPSLLKVLIKRELDKDDVEYLGRIGVKF